MNKTINEKKIVKEIEKINSQLGKMGHFLTIKGIVSRVVNLVEEQQRG